MRAFQGSACSDWGRDFIVIQNRRVLLEKSVYPILLLLSRDHTWELQTIAINEEIWTKYKEINESNESKFYYTYLIPDSINGSAFGTSFIHTLSLTELLKQCKIRMYADDTYILWSSYPEQTTLFCWLVHNKDLQALHNVSISDSLYSHPSKFSAMFFSRGFDHLRCLSLHIFLLYFSIKIFKLPISSTVCANKYYTSLVVLEDNVSEITVTYICNLGRLASVFPFSDTMPGNVSNIYISTSSSFALETRVSPLN